LDQLVPCLSGKECQQRSRSFSSASLLTSHAARRQRVLLCEGEKTNRVSRGMRCSSILEHVVVLLLSWSSMFFCCFSEPTPPGRCRRRKDRYVSLTRSTLENNRQQNRMPPSFNLLTFPTSFARYNRSHVHLPSVHILPHPQPRILGITAGNLTPPLAPHTSGVPSSCTFWLHAWGREAKNAMFRLKEINAAGVGTRDNHLRQADKETTLSTQR